MTLLNLCLNSARGDVDWGNQLSLEIFKTYHIDRVFLYGKWMSFVWQYSPKDTDMNALNMERNKAIQDFFNMGIIYERPVTRYKNEHDEHKEIKVRQIPSISEPVRKEPVQLELF